MSQPKTLPIMTKDATDIEVLAVDSDNPTTDIRIERAKQDAAIQSSMPVREGMRKYRDALMWSALMTLTVVMESYDYGLMGSLFGFPAFAERFGTRLPNGNYNVDAAMQSILKQITKAGQLVGLFFTGTMVDKLGYKWTMLLSLAALAPVILMQFLARNIQTMIAAQFLIGVPLAPFLTLSNVYAAEVAPLCLQPYLTSATSLAWSVGGLISTGVLRGLINTDSTWSYRIAFAVQWVWLLPIALIVWLAPESPTWCIKSNRIDRARAALKRLASPDETDEQVENRLALLQYTDALEKDYAASTSYLELFRGVNRRRTEIAVMVYSCMNLNGYTLAASGTYFFQRAGLDPANSFTLTCSNYAISIIFSMASWWFLKRFGRRQLYITGLAVTVFVQLAIGGLGIPEPSPTFAWATGGFCYFFNVIFNICNGPPTYSIITEIPSTRLRSKTVVFARSCFLLTAVFMVVLTNYQINATAWDWRGKAGFFWAGSCLLCTIWAFFRLPETKNRTAAEIDRLFMDNVSARRFRTTHVEIFDEQDMGDGKVA